MLGVTTFDLLVELLPLLLSSPLRPVLFPVPPPQSPRSRSRSRPELEWVDAPVFELLCFDDDELDLDLLPPLLLLDDGGAGAGAAANADGSYVLVMPESVAADL